VILAQGFYEWKTVGAGDGKQKKQPYFIFAPQDKDSNKVADQVSWTNGKWDETDGWNGPRILKIAGLYDIWKSPSVLISFGGDIHNAIQISFLFIRGMKYTVIQL
jgi:hypothetical protein